MDLTLLQLPSPTGAQPLRRSCSCVPLLLVFGDLLLPAARADAQAAEGARAAARRAQARRPGGHQRRPARRDRGGRGEGDPPEARRQRQGARRQVGDRRSRERPRGDEGRRNEEQPALARGADRRRSPRSRSSPPIRSRRRSTSASTSRAASTWCSRSRPRTPCAPRPTRTWRSCAREAADDGVAGGDHPQDRATPRSRSPASAADKGEAFEKVASDYLAAAGTGSPSGAAPGRSA